MRSLLVLAVAGAGSLFFTGCDDRGDVVYDGRPAYYGGGGGDVDFYYVGGRPYSRSYGELVFRDGGYYYNRGGNYVVYERDSARHGYYANNDRGYGRSDYRNQRETNYRNEAVNNYYGANGTRTRGRSVGLYGDQQTVRGDRYAQQSVRGDRYSQQQQAVRGDRYSQQQVVRGSNQYGQSVRSPSVRTQIRGAAPVQGRRGEVQEGGQDRRKKVEVTY